MTVFDRLSVSALNRKLLRDVWDMRSQAAAIASVIAAGVTMFVMYQSNFTSLQQTRADYYQTQRFADVFATLTRAPQTLEARIGRIPGVDSVSTRVVADVTLDLPTIPEPASGKLISLPDRGRPSLNDVYLRRGRWVDPARADEVLANEMFAEANGFEPGDRLVAIINGRRRQLTIVGIALSPEYLYAVKPGEIVPDRQRYGILWMGRRGLASAFDLEGAFNDVSMSLEPGASDVDVVRQLDSLLEPFGGLGAVPQRLQLSAWTLENELSQLQTFGVLVPAIFFGVAAFILNVALTRALAIQRPQIAALKALGYGNAELAWHYVKWAFLIAAAGALVGVMLGARLGAALITLYNAYFRFPVLTYHLSGDVALEAVCASLVVAAIGAQSAVRRAVRVPPAEAMRPEAPARYRPLVIEGWFRGYRWSAATRMILRNVVRQPMRALLSVTGMAFAVAVLFVGLSFVDIMDDLIRRQFGDAMRQDATVTFVRPRPSSAVFDVAHLNGVMDYEPLRAAPVRVRAGARTRTLAISGVVDIPRLSRVVDRRGRTIEIPAEGLALSKILGEILGVHVGDTVQVEVLEGHRPSLDLTVTALIDDSLGLQAYMRADALHRMLQEGPVVSAVHVTLDPAAQPSFYRAVKAMPAVAGVSLTELAVRNFRETMAETMNLQIFFNVGFAAVIAFGVVYNSARVSLSERERELASLRVLGFTRGEISLILLGELALLTLAALPLGAIVGSALGQLIMSTFSNEIYRLSFQVSASTVAWVYLVVMGSALVSGLLVRRRLDHLDLVAVLKSRE